MATIKEVLRHERQGDTSDMEPQELVEYIQSLERIAHKQARGVIMIIEQLDDTQTQVRIYGNKAPRLKSVKMFTQGIHLTFWEKLRILFF